LRSKIGKKEKKERFLILRNIIYFYSISLQIFFGHNVKILMAEIIYYVHLFNCSGAYIIMCGAYIKEKDF